MDSRGCTDNSTRTSVILRNQAYILSDIQADIRTDSSAREDLLGSERLDLVKSGRARLR